MKYPLIEKILAATGHKVVAAEGSTFTTEVDLEAYLHDLSGKYISGVNWPSQVSLSWSYSIEARSWGIKSLYNYLKTEKLDITCSVDTDDGESEFDVTLDISNLDIKNEYEKGEYALNLFPIKIAFYVEGDLKDPSTWKCSDCTLTWHT